MVFIGLSAVTVGSQLGGFKKPKTVHVNSKYIRYLNEDTMLVVLDDGTTWRITEESLDVFLSAIYGSKED